MDKKLIAKRASKIGAKIVMMGTIAVIGEAAGNVSKEMVNTGLGSKDFKGTLKAMSFEDIIGIK